MIQHKPVLTDDDINDFFRQFQRRRFADQNAMDYALVRDIEQSVLARLAEQEPVVYRFLPPSAQQYMYITDDVPKIKEFEPLYSHPIPATEQEPFAWFINDKRVCGNRIITDPAVARDWLDTDPDKVTPLYTHPCQINSLADGTVIDEGTKEHHRTTKNHIPDAGKMINLSLPIDTKETLTLSTQSETLWIRSLQSHARSFT